MNVIATTIIIIKCMEQSNIICELRNKIIRLENDKYMSLSRQSGQPKIKLETENDVIINLKNQINNLHNESSIQLTNNMNVLPIMPAQKYHCPPHNYNKRGKDNDFDIIKRCICVYYYCVGSYNGLI